VITSIQPRFPADQLQDMATSESEKGAEAAAIQVQKKESEIRAERLPGLNNPNAPAANPAATTAPGQAGKPGQAPAAPAAVTPAPAPHLLPTQHIDRFTPTPKVKPQKDQDSSAPAGKATKPATKPEVKPHQPAIPRETF